MQKPCGSEIKAPGFAFSSAAVMHASWIYLGVTFILLVVLIPLHSTFPALMKIERWLPAILVASIFLLHTLGLFYTVILEPDTVTLKWCGILIRRIPASHFKAFFAVGNGREDILCLSGYSIHDLALMQEKRLLRSFMEKHSVPLLKRKPDWENTFAGDYLNKIRKSPFSIFRAGKFVMLDMHPALQYAIHRMYPHLPYRNFTGVHSLHLSRYAGIRERNAIYLRQFQFQYPEYTFRMEQDGIHISGKDKEISFISSQQIKTAVRVDIFRGYEKSAHHHMPLLFVTGMSEEELAEMPSPGGFRRISLGNAADQGLSAMMAASRLAFQWNTSRKDGCFLPHTESNIQALKTLYPHIHFNDTAATWLQNS